MTNKTPKMTKVHFEFLAQMVNDMPTSLCLDNENDRKSFAQYVGRYLLGTNPNFNYDRFISACTK
jgi:hypothetical protein